jgi:hypothetical protein
LSCDPLRLGEIASPNTAIGYLSQAPELLITIWKLTLTQLKLPTEKRLGVSNAIGLPSFTRHPSNNTDQEATIILLRLVFVRERAAKHLNSAVLGDLFLTENWSLL